MGYGFTNGFRTEAELVFRRNNIKTDGLNGEVDSLAGMANAYYDFTSLNMPVVPYVGAGAGYAQIDPSVNDGINVFAYQFMGGLSYPFSQNASAVLGYRYFATSDMEDKTPGMKLKANYETHNAELGMRIGF